jgi:hypothetical protein
MSSIDGATVSVQPSEFQFFIKRYRRGSEMREECMRSKIKKQQMNHRVNATGGNTFKHNGTRKQ